MRAMTSVGAGVLAGVLAAGCNAAQKSVVAPSATADLTATAVQGGGTGQGWEDFQARGWNCRNPVPGVVVCSPPGQSLPVVAIPPAQPPDDRPETVLLKRWRNGVFDANVLLIRPEIYNGQLCESTAAPYAYIGVLGYFECAHAPGK